MGKDQDVEIRFSGFFSVSAYFYYLEFLFLLLFLLNKNGYKIERHKKYYSHMQFVKIELREIENAKFGKGSNQPLLLSSGERRN